MKQRRLLLALLLAIVLADWTYNAAHLAAFILHPGQMARAPFAWAAVPPEVSGVQPEAASAGMKPGDRVLSINGRKMIGDLTLDQALEPARTGDLLDVEFDDGIRARRASIRLQPNTWTGDAKLSLILALVTLPLCIGLGFLVAFLKPLDHRSWILLLFLVSFQYAFRLLAFPVPSPLRFVLYLLGAPSFRLWALGMMLLGLYFPNRIVIGRWLRAAFTLIGALLLVGAVAAVLMAYGRGEYLPLAAAIAAPVSAMNEVWRIASLLAISSYFVALSRRFRFTTEADARRKLVLLNVGSSIAFIPAFLATMYGLIRHGQPFSGVPTILVIISFCLMPVLPVTLAYVVIVHRALDIRVVLRSGLKYALAQRGVRVLQAVVTLAAFIYAFTVAEHRMNTPQKLMVLAIAFLFSVLLQAVAQRLMQWVDSRFFRAAYNAEHILSELSDEVRGIVRIDELLETVCRKIADSLHVNRMVMFVRGRSGFQPAFALGDENSSSFPLDAPVVHRLEETRQPQTVYLDDPDCWVNRELGDRPDRKLLEEMHSQLLLPVETRKELIGFLSLGPKRSEEPYSKSDLRLLRSVAAQTGMAIENTRLMATVADQVAQRERIQRELEIARDVQNRLFPQRLPVIEGVQLAGTCRPALSVGGDYYDYIALPGGDLGIAVGDVSGKGIPASILMAVLQTSVRGQAMAGVSDLSIFTNTVNRLVDEASMKTHFATLFYGHYDARTRVLRYVNAGHNPPLVIRGGEDIWLKSTGPAVGWLKKARFTEGSVQLERGDVLFAYTDGFTEAMNAVREEWGDARLAHAARQCRAVGPEAVLPAIFKEVDEFMAGESQHDDMTLVVLKVI